MTKNDYHIIAKIIDNLVFPRVTHARAMRKSISDQFSVALSCVSPNFKPSLFEAASTINPSDYRILSNEAAEKGHIRP